MNPLEYHKKLKGKIEVIARAPLTNRADLSLAYTPGVAEPCLEVAKNLSAVYDYTRKGNLVAVVTDGSAVLGLGNIGPEASLPVMEGKCALFKRFADIDAFPIALATQDTAEIIRTVEIIAPVFGGILLEDIAAPRCFEIEEILKNKLTIPVFHDDQHGTAMVALAALYNSLKVVDKKIDEIQVVINGVGAAGVAIAKLILLSGVKNLILVDSHGIIAKSRLDLNNEKQKLASLTNLDNRSGSLADAMIGADVFIGVSKAGLLTSEMVKTMAPKSIILAMANPVPEIMPDIALAAGAAVVATGRSDFPNQINNVLIFPGFFRGLLDNKITKIDEAMKLRAAKALADCTSNPTADKIFPDVFDTSVVTAVARAVVDVD